MIDPLSLDDDADGIVILVPVFNDWESVSVLVAELESMLEGRPARVLIVDDGSTAERPHERTDSRLRVDVLTLRRNLGHQRAIAVGLAFIESTSRCRAVVVMDGDGEDAPADALRLLAESEKGDPNAIVFAKRTKRSESLTFRAGYFAYRLLHRLMTGIAVQIGNFSVIPRPTLSRLVVSSDLWNHYAAAVVRARLPTTLVPTARQARIAGVSRMNLVALVAHGISAMTVFGDRVAVRLLAALAAVGAFLGALAVALSCGIALGWYTPPWWSPAVAFVVVSSVVQLTFLLFVLVFIVLGNRDQLGFVPLRDHQIFVSRVDYWAPKA